MWRRLDKYPSYPRKRKIRKRLIVSCILVIIGLYSPGDNSCTLLNPAPAPIHVFSCICSPVIFRGPSVNTKSCPPTPGSVERGQCSSHVAFLPVLGSVYVILSWTLSGMVVRLLYQLLEAVAAGKWTCQKEVAPLPSTSPLVTLAPEARQKLYPSRLTSDT